MDSDDDDLYVPDESGATIQAPEDESPETDQKPDLEEGEEGEEVEDDGSEEEDVTFITKPKEGATVETVQSEAIEVKSTLSPSSSPRAERKVTPSPAPPIKTEQLKDEASTPIKSEKPGTEYPARHTSTIDPNANPILPSTGKPILSTDFDTDFLGESAKPWRKPGADITDFFNYGFDEFTWASYCLKHQQEMPKELGEIKAQADSMKSFLEGIPGGGFPGMPGMPGGAQGANNSMGGMPSMPGMPSEAEMQATFRNMMESGMDPTAMNPEQFMQQMTMGGGQNFSGQGSGFGGMQGQGQGQQQQFGGNSGRGGFEGRGRGRGRRW